MANYIAFVFSKTILMSEGPYAGRNPLGNPYMFTGRRYEPEAGGLWPLYYYRARYYSTRIGRFLQTDPIGYDGGMNLYTYVGNNPISWVDPYELYKDESGNKQLYTTLILTER